MHQAQFMKNPQNIAQLKGISINSQYSGYVIDKVVEISPVEYMIFSNNLRNTQGILGYQATQMYFDNSNVYRCTLVTVAGATYGILIAREDYDYAGNAALWNYRENG